MTSERAASDRESFEAWCAGDREAGNALLDAHFSSIYRFFSNKLGSDIDDLVQQTFLRCVENRDKFRHDASFRTFLFAVAKNTLFEHLRKKRRSGNIDFSVTSLVELGQSQSSLIASAEQGELVAQALRHLPLELQVALELHYWEELPTADMALALEIPAGTVKSRLRRGREGLAKALADLTKTPVGEDTADAWCRALGIEVRVRS